MTDYAKFRRSTPHGIVLLILYVDDMVITGSDLVAIASLKRHLQSEFEMKDLVFFAIFLVLRLPTRLVAISYLNRSTLLIILIMPP